MKNQMLLIINRVNLAHVFLGVRFVATVLRPCALRVQQLVSARQLRSVLYVFGKSVLN